MGKVCKFLDIIDGIEAYDKAYQNQLINKAIDTKMKMLHDYYQPSEAFTRDMVLTMLIDLKKEIV